MALPVLSRGLARDSVGNYAVFSSGPNIVQIFDENYNLLKTINLDVSGNSGGDQFFIDDSWNSYFNIGGRMYKFDSNGNPVWNTPGPAAAMPPGAYTNGLAEVTAMAVDPLSRQVYLQQGRGNAVVYSQGQYQGQIDGGGQGIAIDTNRHIYTVDADGIPTAVKVLDTDGNLLNTLNFIQFQNPTAIAIMADNTKFVFDTGLAVIHQIDSNDNYVGSFPVNLPSGATLHQGEVAVSQDGNLIVGVGLFNPQGSTNSDTYIKEVTRTGTEIWSIANPNPNFPLESVAVDTSGRIYLLRTNNIEILDPNGNLTNQLDLTVENFEIPQPGAMCSVGDTIYFSANDRIFVVSPN